MKPERIQIAPNMGGTPPVPKRDDVPEREWTATITVDRTFQLAPSSQVPFLACVLDHAQNLPNPPQVTFVIDANRGERRGHYLSVSLEWSDSGPLTAVELDFAQWVSGLHDHLSVAPVVTN